MEDTRTKEQKWADAMEKWNPLNVDLSKAPISRMPLDSRKQNERFWANLCKQNPSAVKIQKPLSEEEIKNMTEEDNERIYQEACAQREKRIKEAEEKK